MMQPAPGQPIKIIQGGDRQFWVNAEIRKESAAENEEQQNRFRAIIQGKKPARLTS